MSASEILFGSVVDDQGTGLPGVTVTLDGGGAAQVQVTDDHGQFQFPELTPGAYTASTALPGYLSVKRSVSIVAGRDTTMAEFVLVASVG